VRPSLAARCIMPRDWGAPDAALRQAATPHSFRHSSETHLHAAGIDPADLAATAGHSISRRITCTR
jgi:integrase